MDRMIRNLDPKIYRLAKARAAEQGRSMGELFNDALRDYLGLQPRMKKRKGKSIADLPVFDFGPGSEHWSENKLEALYGDRP
jgi:hypothetical protein